MARAFSNFNLTLVSRINSHDFIQPLLSLRLSNKKSMVMTIQSQNNDYWESKEAQIEAFLKKVIPVRPPIEVFEPMHNLVMTSRKTKAAVLCMAAFELVEGGSSIGDSVSAALALQLVYATTCLHEQLPLTDQPRLNPNIGSIGHHYYTPNIELLIGDGIVPFAFELLSQSADPIRNNSGRVMRVIVELSRAMGTLVHDQYEEVKIENSKGGDDALIEHVLKKKEGGLHACGAACGAILGGGSEEEIEKLRRFGLYVGMIQGIVNNVGNRNDSKKRFVKRVEELRLLAMEELEHFKGRNDELIASLVTLVRANYLDM